MNDERPTNRREFLGGQSAVEALAGAIDGQVLPVAPPFQSSPSSQPYLIRIGRRAMACEFEIIFNAGQYPQATDCALAALDLVEELESQMTVYRDGGEIMEINHRAAAGPVCVERNLYELLKLAVTLNQETNGAYDVTSGPLSKVWGFFRRKGAIPESGDLATALTQVGSNHLRFDDHDCSIRFLRPGIELNLGGIGKGHAIDRVAALLRSSGIQDFLIHGGQSSILAGGSQAGCQRPGWPVGICDAARPGQRLATVYLRDRAVGTSGAAVQFFRHQGRRLGHILDPRTGWPAEGVLSATAVAPSGAEADALATAFYVLGAENSVEYCRNHAQVAALVMGATAVDGPNRLHIAGLADDEIEFCGPNRPGS